MGEESGGVRRERRKEVKRGLPTASLAAADETGGREMVSAIRLGEMRRSERSSLSQEQFSTDFLDGLSGDFVSPPVAVSFLNAISANIMSKPRTYVFSRNS